MTPRRRAVAVLGGAAVALAVAWVVAPQPSPPLYDGVALPNQPYRYLHPPPGFDRTPPNPAHQTVAVTDGQSPPMAVFTDEQPPQAQLLVAPGAFPLPPGTTAVDVTIEAVDPPATAPAGTIDGNVYRFAVSAGGTTLALKSGQVASVVLRGPAGAGSPKVEVFAGGAWKSYDTNPVGSPDTYVGNVSALGEAALVLPAASHGAQGGGGAASTGGSSVVVPVVIAVAVLLVLVAVIVAVRLARRAEAPRRRR